MLAHSTDEDRIRTFFECIDSNNDGLISRTDLLSNVPSIWEAQIDSCFRVIDMSNQGTITLGQLTKFLKFN